MTEEIKLQKVKCPTCGSLAGRVDADHNLVYFIKNEGKKEMWIVGGKNINLICGSCGQIISI